MTETLPTPTTPDVPSYVCIRPMDIDSDYAGYRHCKKVVGSWDDDLDNFANVQRLLREQPATILMADCYDAKVQKLHKNAGTVKAAFRGEWPLIGGLGALEEY